MSPCEPLNVERAAAGLGIRDGGFLRRCFADGFEKYHRRLRLIGFHHLGSVLDAGCGFGQWSLALAETCRRVEGIDLCERRIGAARTLGENLRNTTFRVGSLEQLPYDDATFDGVFCYSAIYYSDVRRSLAELVRVLKPGGAIYVCSNGPGWYWYNIVRAPHKSADFHPRRYGLSTFLATAAYKAFGIPPRNGRSIITTRRGLVKQLRRLEVDVVGYGGEGTVSLVAGQKPQNFFRDRYWGLECSSEWLGRKRSAAATAMKRAA